MLASVPAESGSAEPPTPEPGVSSPARLHKASPEELGSCYASSARRTGSEGSIKVIATIESDGSVSQVTLPPGIEPWQEETAQCVMKLLRFDAAVVNGVPAQSKLTVPINFSLSNAPVLIPPRMRASSREEFGRCYSNYVWQTEHEGRLHVTVTVEADGSVGPYELQPDIEPWQEETARCVLRILRFHPATLDGVPVASQATLPLYFGLAGSPQIESPTLISTQSDFEDAMQGCYPLDSQATAKAQYRVVINRAGKATKITIVEPTGDEALDQAGICVLKLLEFKPTMRGKAAVESIIVLPVTLAPPR